MSRRLTFIRCATAATAIAGVFYLLLSPANPSFLRHINNATTVFQPPRLGPPSSSAGPTAGETFLEPICLGDLKELSAKPSSLSAGLSPMLRIIVMTFNRSSSLQRCLTSLNNATYDDTSVRLDIFIDRDEQGKVDKRSLLAAHRFGFRHGASQVHVHPSHVGLYGQWLRTWCVAPDATSEIVVFLEDDVSVSPYFARWLRLVHSKYDGYPGVNGYALQSESVKHADNVSASDMLQGPPGERVFLYPVLGSWGFSPNAGPWRDFIRWYARASRDKGFIPYVPGLRSSSNFVNHRKAGRASSMWTMWHIYHAYKNQLSTLYASFPDHQGLSHNWKEPGLHYSTNASARPSKLLSVWDSHYGDLPDSPVLLDVKGEVIGRLDPPPRRALR